jgi:hypothetical protein
MIVEPAPGLDVGRIVVAMRVENWSDLNQAARNLLPAGDVRRLDVEAVLDTDGMLVSLPTRDIRSLGLRPVRQWRTRTAAGLAVQQIYSAVVVTVEGRDCVVQVTEVPDGSPALVGRAPLQMMDFWIDTASKRLAGNPEHGGEWMSEQY